MKMKATVIAIIAASLLAACTTAPKKDLALEQVRAQLDELKANDELAGYAPLALGEAHRSEVVSRGAGEDEVGPSVIREDPCQSRDRGRSGGGGEKAPAAASTMRYSGARTVPASRSNIRRSR